MCGGNLTSRLYLILPLLFLAWNSRSTNALSCKDENNKDVDWFINVKLPKIEGENKDTYLYKGEAYAYLTPKEDSKWVLSSVSVSSENSMLGKTWKEFSNKRKDASYLVYNDDPPANPAQTKKSSVGHLKGMIVFDGKSGFWLTHSVPRFLEKDKYEFPESAETNGQTAMCITFNASQVNEICNHLLYCHPNIYEKEITKDVENLLNDNAKSIFYAKPRFIRLAPFTYESKLQSLGGLAIRSFAKDNQLKEDIYSKIIAPRLETSLFVETWRRGAGVKLDSACRSKHTVVDISSIKMPALDKGKSKDIAFKSTEDHGKWAISTGSSAQWVCIGDLNRMNSQASRGGGALCFQSKNVWKAFDGMIGNTNTCTI